MAWVRAGGGVGVGDGDDAAPLRSATGSTATTCTARTSWARERCRGRPSSSRSSRHFGTACHSDPDTPLGVGARLGPEGSLLARVPVELEGVLWGAGGRRLGLEGVGRSVGLEGHLWGAVVGCAWRGTGGGGDGRNWRAHLWGAVD